MNIGLITWYVLTLMGLLVSSNRHGKAKSGLLDGLFIKGVELNER